MQISFIRTCGRVFMCLSNSFLKALIVLTALRFCTSEYYDLNISLKKQNHFVSGMLSDHLNGCSVIFYYEDFEEHPASRLSPYCSQLHGSLSA